MDQNEVATTTDFRGVGMSSRPATYRFILSCVAMLFFLLAITSCSTLQRGNLSKQEGEWSEGTRYICVNCGAARYVLIRGAGETDPGSVATDEISDTELSTWWNKHYEAQCDHLWVDTWVVLSSSGLIWDFWVIPEPDLINLNAKDREVIDGKFEEDPEGCRIYTARRLHKEVKEALIAYIDRTEDGLGEMIDEGASEDEIEGTRTIIDAKKDLLQSIIESEKAISSDMK